MRSVRRRSKSPISRAHSRGATIILNHLPAALPYKEMNGAFAWERFAQSVDALQQIALQNKGVPGRKNIVWVGHGGPGIYLDSLAFSGKVRDELKEYAHESR